jgi:TPR repeat protein
VEICSPVFGGVYFVPLFPMKRLLFLFLVTLGLCGAEAPMKSSTPIDIVTVKPRAEAGDARAQYELGTAYYSGRGVKKDVEEATKWYRLASEQGEPDGQCAYAALLLDTGSKPKMRLALGLYQKAAAQNNARALFTLGSLYYAGRGVERDPFVGAQWYEKAAYAGSVSGQYNMGVLLSSDEGPAKRNDVDGLAWLTLASDAGDKSAAEARDKLMKEVKLTVVASAQARSLEFKAEIERLKHIRDQGKK